MKQWVLLLFAFFLAACGNTTDQQSAIGTVQDSVEVNTATTFIDTTALPMYFNVTDPVVMADTAFIYSKPDSSAAVMDKLYFNNPLSIVSPEDYWKGWYELRLGTTKGYIPVPAVAAHRFKATINRSVFYYYIVTGNSERYNPLPNGFTIYKFDTAKKQFTDTLAVKDTRADIVKEMNHTGWKNAGLLLYTKQVNAYCGGGETELYLIDANNKMEQLFTTYSYADDGEGGGGGYATVAFPKNVDADTIALRKWEEAPVYTKKGKLVKKKDGDPEQKIENDTVKYYKWDGKRLGLVRMVEK